MPKHPPPISRAERETRLAALRQVMEASGAGAVLLGATSSLRYFTGVAWHPSERFCGAIVHADRIEYVAPRFELEKVAQLIGVAGEILTWEEDEDPYRLIADRMAPGAALALDDQMALFMYHRLRETMSDERLRDAGPPINALRRQKSAAELALMQHAKNITLEVQRRAWKQLRAGQLASDVARFIDAEHRALGGNGNTFCIVSFAEDTSLPHGGEGDRALAEGDVVLIDTGTQIDGYNSDITRTYVFGEASKDVRAVWDTEKAAQAAAFAAAELGAPCESPDNAARAVLESAGYGPDYRLPGLPHRTGHGIGLDVHEAPNLVRGDRTPLDVGMCFSNEPMIVVPGRFGVRHEDHFYMTDKGPKWFTEPAHSLDEPFKNVAEWR
jgi:Xaa-Pro dipeptidase